MNNIEPQIEIGAPKQTIGLLIRSCIYGKEDVVIGGICVKRTQIWALWRFFKYGVVGVTSLLIHASLYHVMSRTIWVSGNRTIQYTLALFFAATVNFTLHRIWTYQAGAFAYKMLFRYATVVGSSMLLQSAIFYVCLNWLRLFDYVAFAASAVLAIVFQYIFHGLFTFRKKGN